MRPTIELLGTYLHLAEASRQRQRRLVRDRLLVLAASLAQLLELPRIAAFCRHEVLDDNPQHLLRRWPDLGTALGDDDFLHFLQQLARRYPQEKAEQMPQQLGIERGHERAAYYSDEEYAAALLGRTLADLENFGPADESAD